MRKPMPAMPVQWDNKLADHHTNGMSRYGTRVM